jgi:hypothetical protein
MAALVCAAALLGACGGGGSDPDKDTHTDTDTTESYREAASAICRRHKDAEQVLASSARPEEAVAFYRGLVGLSLERTRALRRLDPPPGLAEHHDMMVSGFEQQDRILRRELLPRIAAGADPAKTWERVQVRASRFNVRSDVGAGRMDLRACTFEG